MDDEVVTLNALDRCDGCGAQAYFVARRIDQPELKFCMNHMKRTRSKLEETNWVIFEDVIATGELKPANLVKKLGTNEVY